MTFLILLAGCVIGGNDYQRPRDLPSSHLVDRPRLLAIAVEPPELRPGDTATVAALLADADGEIDLQVWLACPPELATSFGCAIDLSVLTEDATPAELAEAGIIGFLPGFAPTLTVPPDALEGLDAADREKGLYWTVQMLGLPAAEEGQTELDFNEIESGHKRVVVSESLSPNLNPVAVGLRFDDQPLPPAAVVEIDAGASYLLSVDLDETTVETYTFLNPAGEVEQRTEAPFVIWYATAGSWYNGTSLYPTLSDTWTAPAEPGLEGAVWAVIRDRRGGMAWHEQRWRTVGAE